MRRGQFLECNLLAVCMGGGICFLPESRADAGESSLVVCPVSGIDNQPGGRIDRVRLAERARCILQSPGAELHVGKHDQGRRQEVTVLDFARDAHGFTKVRLGLGKVPLRALDRREVDQLDGDAAAVSSCTIARQALLVERAGAAKITRHPGPLSEMVDRAELTNLILEFECEEPRLVSEFRDRVGVAIAQPDPRQRQQSVDPRPIDAKLTGKLYRKSGLATRVRCVSHSEGEPSCRDQSLHTLRGRPFAIRREQTRDPAAAARETSSHEPETLEQSRRSQTEPGIGPTGIFERRFELHLFALESVVTAFWTRPGQLGRRLQQSLEVRGAHGRILRAVLQVILYKRRAGAIRARPERAALLSLPRARPPSSAPSTPLNRLELRLPTRPGSWDRRCLRGSARGARFASPRATRRTW